MTDSLNVHDTVNGWHITMNRYEGDPNIQVFITSLNDDSVERVDYVPLNQVDSLIKEVTGISLDDHAEVAGLL